MFADLPIIFILVVIDFHDRNHRTQGLNEVKSMDGGKVSFRDLLGVHDLWKAYASRLVSQCKSNRKLVQQRILSADLQVTASIKSQTFGVVWS